MLKENQIWVTTNSFNGPCVIIITGVDNSRVFYSSAYLKEQCHSHSMDISTLERHIASCDFKLFNTNMFKTYFYEFINSPWALQPDSPFLTELKNSAKAE